MKTLKLLILAFFSMSLTGCPDDAQTDPVERIDSGLSDAGDDDVIDGAVADARLADAAFDAALDDGAIAPDAGGPDAGGSDAAVAVDAGPDAMPPPPDRCTPPCSAQPACDGHLVCEAGACVPVERMACEGECVDGACAEVNCLAPEDQCGGPLKWLVDLVRYNGDMRALRSLMVGAVNDTSDRVYCGSQAFAPIRCIDPERPIRRLCEARNVSRAQVDGALSYRDEMVEQCNEFSNLREFEFTANGYENTPFGDREPRLQMDGTATRADETYYAPSWRWRLALRVDSAVARLDRPVWARTGATRIDATGRYSRGTEPGADFPSAGYRETAGTAQATRPDGRQWTAEWDVRWQPPFDAMNGEPPQPGCLDEPWEGEAQVQETLADGTPGSQWILVFDGGRSAQFCTGNVSVIKDGMGEPSVRSLPF